jgi:hypothetical protein
VLFAQDPDETAHSIGRFKNRIYAAFFQLLVMTHNEEAQYFDGPGYYFRRKVHSRIHTASDLLQYGERAEEHSMLPGQNFDCRFGVLAGLAGSRARRQNSGARGPGQSYKTSAGKGAFKTHRFSWDCQERLISKVFSCPGQIVHLLFSCPDLCVLSNTVGRMT